MEEPTSASAPTTAATSAESANDATQTASVPRIPYETLEKIAHAYLDEQRANRRWRNVYRIGILLLALIAAGAALDLKWGGKPPSTRHTALIEITGEIDSDSPTASVD
ncbi:MAG: hypothetical protein ACKO4M_10850, partial [Betaproteobacteria bacterium]